MNLLLQDMLFCYKYGIKTGYYFNTHDGAGEIEVADAPEVEDDNYEEECEACVI